MSLKTEAEHLESLLWKLLVLERDLTTSPTLRKNLTLTNTRIC